MRAALDLKHANRVRFLHNLESRGVICRNMREVERPPALATQFQCILHHRHHAEPEQIHFDDAEIFTIVLVPLRDDAPRHGRVFERHERAEFVLADDHAAGVLAEMPR